ncbi:MAG: AAA family ATPase [Pyrinomonadaceae bacterium]
MADRAAFDVVAASTEVGAFSEDLLPIWEAVRKYYDLSPEAVRADTETVVAYAVEPMPNPKHRKDTEAVVRDIGAGTADSRNVAELVRLAALARVRNELGVALSSRKGYEDVEPLLLQFQSLSVPSSDDPELSWNGIVRRRTSRKNRMRVSPRSLNDAIGGGLLPGHNVTIFGLTESGKSALALSMAVGFARRGIKVLYIINEDAAADLMVRAVSCITGQTYDTMESAPDEAEKEAIRLGIGNIVMRELAPGSLAEVEKLVRQNKPAVLIVDQLRNLRGTKTDNFTQMLDKVAQGVRAIGKKYKIATISVTQAADSARDRSVLDTGDIDSSNIGIPGAADVLIGIGVTQALYNAGQRMLSICKNKLSGRHMAFPVNFRAETSRFTTV